MCHSFYCCGTLGSHAMWGVEEGMLCGVLRRVCKQCVHIVQDNLSKTDLFADKTILAQVTIEAAIIRF